MSYSEDILLRYLFGELSETERVELETAYFADPPVFDRLEHVENDLIDDYARGRLSPRTRARFERAYLSNPNRRARLKFGEALAGRLDRSEPPLAKAASGGAWWQSLFSSLRQERRPLAFSMAVVFLALVFGSVWLLVQSGRLRAELAKREAAEATPEQHDAELQRQLADEQKRNQGLTAELQQRSKPVTPPTKPSLAATTPTFVTLRLAANGVRGAETASPPTLVVPKGTEKVHVQLTLTDHDYQRYQIGLQAIPGPEIVNPRKITPRIGKSGATFSLSLPASKLASGDYMLTLRGASQAGEFEDVSKSLFRVETR
ncbi:MAG: hypothetical protein ACREDR_17600 [Blastocatellia bacterium]